MTRRDRMLLRKIISLRYETTPDQLRLVLGELRKMLLAHPRILEDRMRVRAIGFGSSSLDLELFVYVNTQSMEDFFAVQEDVVLRIMEIVKEAGTSFAFPSQTVYHTRDPGLDPERQKAAEKQVREWIAGHVLPFPDFDSTYRQEILDTLDYPPKGSHGSRKD
jgi:MscS family membrane protein